MSGFVSSGFSVGGRQGAVGAIKMAIVGGTVSALGGGKFANGAMGSAFQYLFNDMTFKQSIKKLWNRKGEIVDDIGQGFEGGLQGYRDVRDNAPSGIKAGLQVIMTVTETGLTGGFIKGFSETYDFTSGMLFDTSPLGSKSSMAGFYFKQYVDSFYTNENYELKNLVPINY